MSYVFDDGCCPHGKLHVCPEPRAGLPDVETLMTALPDEWWPFVTNKEAVLNGFHGVRFDRRAVAAAIHDALEGSVR